MDYSAGGKSFSYYGKFSYKERTVPPKTALLFPTLSLFLSIHFPFILGFKGLGVISLSYSNKAVL